MSPRSTTSSHTTRSPTTVRSGVSTRRAWDAPVRGAAALLAGSAAFLGVSCGRDTGYATSSAFWTNSVSVGWYLPTLCSVVITSPLGR